MTFKTNFPTKPITAEDVVAVFRAHSGKGPCPDAATVKSIAHYLEMIAPNHIATQMWTEALGPTAVKQSRSEFGKSADGRFRDALWKIIELGPGIISYRETRLDQPTVGMRFGIGHLLGAQILSAPEERAVMLSSIGTLQTVVDAAKRAAAMFTPPRLRGRPSERWHITAQALGPMIAGAFRAAGRKHASLTTPSGPAVNVLVWALGYVGFEVSNEAVVKVFKRRKLKTRTKSGS